jgi:hypothetical protein
MRKIGRRKDDEEKYSREEEEGETRNGKREGYLSIRIGLNIK